MTPTPPAEVTATEFRNDIARIFRDAHYGHPITITNNGEPFVKLVHPDADDGELDALKAEMEVQRAIVAEFDQVATEKGAELDALKAAVQHLAAEAHRRKWAHEHSNPAAFAVLHLLGNELSAALDTPAPTTRTETP